EASKTGVKIRDEQVRQTQAELEKTKRERDTASQQLETERQGRLAAEAKVVAAMKDLQEVARVKEEARGVVITLSGSVLFASGKWALLETAKQRLDQVAEALKAQDEGKAITVEGHTDSMGSDVTNEELSKKRADSVREYLVSRGVPTDRIR